MVRLEVLLSEPRRVVAGWVTCLAFIAFRGAHRDLCGDPRGQCVAHRFGCGLGRWPIRLGRSGPWAIAGLRALDLHLGETRNLVALQGCFRL